MRPSPSLKLGGFLTLLVSLLAVVSRVWTPADPLMVDTGARFLRPSLQHIFGTDQLGRDVFSGVMQGGQTTLLTALLAMTIAMVIGGSAGVVAAVSSRWIDDAVTTVATVFVAFPALLLALLIVAARGASSATAVITVGIAAGASVAVVTRREAHDVMSTAYILAARYSGTTTWSLVRRHLLRNLAPSLIVQATGAASVAIVAESTLSYLGLGTTPPTPSWGRMLASTQQYLLVHPLLTFWPALFISVSVLGINLLGDGLRERLDPVLVR
jgi:peptide/nickel transport system permease protein